MEQLCENVTTVEDDIVENSESLVLSLASPESQIIIPINSVEVTIDDDDGKQMGYALQFTSEVYEISESDEGGQVCVEIASGHTIARSIPFTIQSVLSEETTAEGTYKEVLISFGFYVVFVFQWTILWEL